ncbi:hypothetical protein [Streptacidiphilus carbonis]|uniref:hypothetical protein n=1 Tax=Streptacidiphilus carbonis TaxID=105422 RepID=UPI0006949906|nr:hypothetical protein [Streptacidiphilus carbonis]
MPLHTFRRRVSGFATLVLAAVLVPVAASPAFASGSAYGEWAADSLTVPAVGFPAATVTTTSSSTSVPSGSSAYLNDSTPFGSAYGSSRGHAYLALRTATGLQPSVTTIDFARPTPVGWGFALGDVDADHVKVTATGADGSLLTAAQLGFQGSFNYCQGTPKPSACTGNGPFTDMPHWDAATTTLIGSNTGDTSGASGWLRPTVPVKSLTLTFSVQSGIPVYQIWAATKTVQVSGRITSECGTHDPAELELLDSNGDPVLNAAGHPVTTTSHDDGSYSFPDLAEGSYRVALRVPEGLEADTTRLGADATKGDVTGADFNLRCAPVVEPPVTLPPNSATPLRFPISIISGLAGPIAITDPPEHAIVVVDPAHPGTLLFEPEPGFSGVATFVYEGRDKRTGKVVFVKETVRVPKAEPAPRVRPAAVTVIRPQLAASGAGENGSALALALAVGLIAVGAAVAACAGMVRRRR